MLQNMWRSLESLGVAFTTNLMKYICMGSVKADQLKVYTFVNVANKTEQHNTQEVL